MALSILFRGRVRALLALLGGSALLPVSAAAAPEPLNWLTGHGAVTTGSTLQSVRTSGLTDTAVGAEALLSGDGSFEFTTGEADRAKVAGLGARDSNRGIEAIDFGFLLRADGTVALVEKGSAVQSAGTYAAGDRFRVSVESGAVAFRINGIVLRTSALTFAYPLFAEAALEGLSASIVGAELDGATGETVSWAGQVKATASPGFLSKSTGVTAWDAAAFSTMALSASDGYLEVPAAVAPTIAMIGLSYGNANSGYSDIDYALYMSSGTLYIYEGGVNRGSFGSFTAADRFRVSVENGAVKYRKNGALVYSSAVTPTFPLLVDASFTRPARESAAPSSPEASPRLQ